MTIIGEKIKEIREERGLSLREFSKLVKLSHTNIARFEKGYDSKGIVKGSMQIDDIKQICDRAGYPLRLLLEETGYIEPSEKSEIEMLYNDLSPISKIQLIEYAKTLS